MNTDIHSAILSLLCKPESLTEACGAGGVIARAGYLFGHRDALRDAANLVLPLQERLAKMEEALRGMVALIEGTADIFGGFKAKGQGPSAYMAAKELLDNP